MALIKIKADAGKRGELFQVADVFRAKVVDVGFNSVVFEMTGTPTP